MNEPAKKPQYGVELPAVRRFALADIAQHSKWILPRLVKTYPHLNDRTALGFLNNVLYSAEFYFCYQPNAVGLVQIERGHLLTPDAIVREKFVWVEDANEPDHIDQAVAFYPEFIKFGERWDAKVMIVEENSDVPHDKIRPLFDKRIFSREQKFVRIG